MDSAESPSGPSVSIGHSRLLRTASFRVEVFETDLSSFTTASFPKFCGRVFLIDNNNVSYTTKCLEHQDEC